MLPCKEGGRGGGGDPPPYNFPIIHSRLAHSRLAQKPELVEKNALKNHQNRRKKLKLCHLSPISAIRPLTKVATKEGVLNCHRQTNKQTDRRISRFYDLIGPVAQISENNCHMMSPVTCHLDTTLLSFPGYKSPMKFEFFLMMARGGWEVSGTRHSKCHNYYTGAISDLLFPQNKNS